jgi:FkbM family methyltransferase
MAPGPADPDEQAAVMEAAVVAVTVGSATARVVDTSGERYGDFWAAFADGTFEPATVDVLRAWARPGRLLVDVGAWIGPFTLLAAAHGATVHAVEPDPVAADVLRRNSALNPELAGRLTIDEVAWAAHDGRAALAAPVGLGNARSALAGRRVRGQAADGAASETVEVSTRAAASAYERAVFDVRAATGRALGTGDVLLKIDIEGGEFAVVPSLGSALALHRPVLLLSVHQPPSPGRLRSLPLRVRRLPAMARVLWALRGYPSVSRANGHRELGWRRLGRVERALLAVRLGEFELLVEP